jgi:predicted AAA+ superfamily ATPase
MVENIIKPWRFNVVPNKDVREGKYENAEFMADLQQVYLGKAEEEYQNPDIFFSRTKLTRGIKSTIRSILKRVCDLGGDPVDRLKVTLGGGKTHTEIFIYHFFGKDADKNPLIKNLLNEMGIEKIPKVSIAIIVGSAIGPSEPIEIPGLNHYHFYNYHFYNYYFYNYYFYNYSI